MVALCPNEAYLGPPRRDFVVYAMAVVTLAASITVILLPQLVEAASKTPQFWLMTVLAVVAAVSLALVLVLQRPAVEETYA